MRVVDKKIVAFDVDDTLVIWNYPSGVQHCAKEFNNYGFTEYLVPNYRMIDALIRNYSQGHHIVVWSANGSPWAKEVITKLKLSKYVHDIFPKFDLVFDDLRPEEFLMRAYLEPNWNDPRYSKSSKEEG